MSRFSIDWSELSLQVMITFSHFLWQACVVGFVLLVVQHVGESLRDSRILSHRRGRKKGVSLGETDLREANFRYAITCLAFITLPFCVIATFAWIHQSRGPVFLATSEPATSIRIPDVGAPQPIPALESMEVPPLPTLEMPADTAIPSIEPLKVIGSALPLASWHDWFQSFAPYLLMSYTIGVGLMLARFGLSIVNSSRLRRALQPITDSSLVKIIAEQSSRLGLRRLPIVALCERVSVPVVVGIVKPMILLPPALLCGLDPNQLAAILSHEMAHIRRYDLLVNLLQRIVEALLFFHPVTWWISRRIHIERENCCDDMAAAGCGRMEYAAALLRMAEQCATIRGLKIVPQLESLAADGGSTSQLGYRIKRLLGEDDTPRISLTRSAIARIALTTAFSGLAMIAVAQSGGQETSIDRNGADELPSDSRRRGKSVPAPVAIAESATDDTPANQTEQIKVEEVENPATKLARDTHANAAAIDRLPRFYWASDNGTLGTFVLSDPSENSLDNFIRSLDAPDGGAKWFTYHAQFGWDENHYIESTGGTPTDEVSQFYWGTRELAGEKNGRGDAVSHVLLRGAASMWKDHYLSFPNYILATRHVFWWGDNGDHRKILAGTGVPPAMADYEQLPDQTFDGELCSVVQSTARQEMLFISKASRLLRGYVLIGPSGYPDEFYKSEKVKAISGVEFSSQREYADWSRNNESKMSGQQKWDLAKAWALACDWSSPTASLLVRFRDYREIAPGIMWPFREDRVQGSMRNERFECMRSYDHVHEVAVDKDLTEKVNSLRPKDGEQVQDQRFQAIIDYKSSKDRSNAEIMKLVDEAFERQMKNQLVVDRAKKPYESMIGMPAPKLPEQNWVGGQRPELEGKPYLVHLWATWCGPCKNDLPRLKRFSDAGGTVIGLHPGGTAVDEVTAAIKAAELSHPTYVSPETTSADISTIAGYPATMYPYCLLVNGKGIVVAHGSPGDDKFDVFAQYWKLVKINKTSPSTTPRDKTEQDEGQKGAKGQQGVRNRLETLEEPDSTQRANNHHHAVEPTSWIPARPVEAAVSSGGTARILDDHSVRLEGDVQWQEASLQFEFGKPTNVEEIRLELLSVDSPTGPQFGRGGDELMLFDVKPSIEGQTGKSTSIDFASCTYLQNPSDETTANCIDQLSDTGWKVPPLPAEAAAHELILRFEKPITLRADQRLTLTVDSGGAEELAVLNRIRFAFRQGAVSEPLSVNSTMNGRDVGALNTAGGANEKVEPWEISRLYEPDFLRNYLQDHEVLPKPIIVPAVSGRVFDPDGKPASGVSIVSHTPRHWVDLDATLALKPHNSGGVRSSKQNGTFGLPERTEPYRVLLVHESGVANVSHEELLRANGNVTLQQWASVTGTLKLDGKPQADETIMLDFDTLSWSYSRLGPRLTTTHRTTTDRDGNFSFDRVPPLGGMARSLSGYGAVYQCESGKNTHIEIGAGNAETLTLSHDHDHHHDEVKQEDWPADKPQLPRLIVKTVDSNGKPVPDTGVLFYDRNSHRAGQKQKFEMVNRRTDESGVADFGVIPNSFGCLQLSSHKELAECYTLISTTMTKCTQGNPPRANVQTEIKDGILTVTFTMTPHVDLEFNIVDDATNEIVFWSEIFYQDPTTARWWMFGLVDGSKTQHNFIPISPQITNETIRISALGYETKVFRLPDELDRSQPIRRDVRLKPMPGVELKVLLPDGTPAEKANLTFHYPNELDCLQNHEQLSDAQGIVTTKFPPSADIGIFRLEHTGGTAELSMKELLDDVKLNPGEVIQRSLQLRK